MPQKEVDAKADHASSAELASHAPRGAVAHLLLERWRAGARRSLIFIAAGESRAEHLAANIHAMDRTVDVMVLPRWDCLPYDTGAPSRGVTGRRTSVLRRLAEPRRSSLLIATPEALLQRVPPRRTWATASRTFRPGGSIDPAELTRFLELGGYTVDDRVDDPGEAAVRGQVVDVFPAGALGPARIEYEAGRIVGIATYDAATQRSIGELAELTLDPASEVVLDAEDGPAECRFVGIEHWLPAYYAALDTLFDYLPGAAMMMDEGVHDRALRWLDQIAAAFEASKTLPRFGESEARAHRPLSPEALYLDATEWRRRTKSAKVLRATGIEAVPRFALERNPSRALVAFVRDQVREKRRVVLAAATAGELRVLARRAEQKADRASQWAEVLDAAPGTARSFEVDFDQGFVLSGANLAVVTAADLLGSRAAHWTPMRIAAAAPDEFDSELRVGDAIVHLEHGVGLLRGLETLAVANGVLQDTIRLEYAHGATLMIPVEEVGAIWRYGGEADAVSLDRLNGETWPKRRAKLLAEIDETAAALLRLTKERQAITAPKLTPRADLYEKFVSGFGFTETPDQVTAIEDVRNDLASGRPMNRLVCGDVGFGKTEVALRAAAAAVLGGKQVAVIAPTTVLARQHLATFRRRFAPLGITVGHLSRLVKAAEATATKKALRAGDLRVVVGTHSLAGKELRFHDLGLVIIDEEQRFGARQKSAWKALSEGLHALTLTATPIPRTLQDAMIGLTSISVIATPPARRRPVRTLVLPYDGTALRTALLHEKRRQGQSFVVCPRIEDIAPMDDRLAELAPDLKRFVIHGKMPPAEIDELMLRFADGDGDVLLATNLIESGLDLPRANTMVIWRADRFGMAQLHQLRGRVGRGTRRGSVLCFLDPERMPGAVAKKRLEAFQSINDLGAGFVIAQRDLDLRGAGDILGEQQAGHVRLVGLELYRHLLRRAFERARSGRAVEELAGPELKIEGSGSIPATYVPEVDVRINLYARLARLSDAKDIEQFADEIEDRFGPIPSTVRDLLDLARARSLCRAVNVTRIDAGPQGVALTFGDPAPPVALESEVLRPHGERFIHDRQPGDPGQIELVVTLLERLQPA
jgi:transcription-repair coupling factor (superfamily II helicase)